jgi:hypothetical protein
MTGNTIVFGTFLHVIRVEGGEARMLKDGLIHILLFRTGGFNRRVRWEVGETDL